MTARRQPRFSIAAWAVLAQGVVGAMACGNGGAPNPFGSGGAGGFDFVGGGGAAGPSSSSKGGGGGDDPTLGGPCNDDGQCDDELACTLDRCDKKLGRCRFTPDDSVCQNDVYCDGIERCDLKLGCVPGEPVSCEDPDPCTVNRCNEETHGCEILARDVDGDGDPDLHCGGGDCDDTDPTVSSKKKEICDNEKDDDCDGKVDEAKCVAPKHDGCVDALEITTQGTYALDTTGTVYDYPSSCGPADAPNAGDVVLALELPAGPPRDVIIKARSKLSDAYLAIGTACGDPSSELACGASFNSSAGGGLAKIVARNLGSLDEPTVYAVTVASGEPSPLSVRVDFAEPSEKPTNETCGTAAPIVPGVPEIVPLVDAADDVASACPTPMGDLLYTFTLETTSDVNVFATTLDGDGLPVISLRGAACALPEDELACSAGPEARIFRHSLPAGDYFVVVSASAPTDVSVVVEVSDATPAPPEETCSTAPPIAPNKTKTLDMSGYQDDVAIGCLANATDAAFALDLAVPSDVLLVGRVTAGDFGAVELASPSCSSGSLLACAVSSLSPVRVGKHNVPAGSYRAVAESLGGGEMQFTAFVRPAVPATQVIFGDACDDAFVIPPSGGFFQGTTANAQADFNAGCDQSDGTPNGAPEQLLKLVLSKKKRVVLDMAGSAYDTLLDVRRGPGCPGAEVTLACAVGYGTAKSFLDLTLNAGTYFIQIDGYAGSKGPWFLDVRVVEP